MIPPRDLIVVGEVTRPHGLHGAIRVLPVTDFPERLPRLRRVAVVQGGAARMLAVESAEPAGRFVAMKLAGIDTVEEAAALRGATIEIPAAEAAPLPPGEFYVFQIVGLRARTPGGEVLGEVVDVLRTGSNDVYVIRTSGGGEVLVPAVEGVIEAVDLAAGELVVRPPEWL
ncbi:MAG TPA: ribosome maturation factor RimM [bacterium]|nr:ribosome maturation factor RimM [bacterium]HEV2440327.1 ribosome maturation factor RimM [bacterium]